MSKISQNVLVGGLKSSGGETSSQRLGEQLDAGEISVGAELTPVEVPLSPSSISSA
jgi:hypothetical protein